MGATGMLIFNREIFFEKVRFNPFGGTLDQGQVDGMNYILEAWETYRAADDVRWLANFLAQSMHETASTMLPVAEYGKGAGQPYGKTDLETGQQYYGRGYIQITWRENYHRADVELGFTGDDRTEWNADLQLKPDVSARAGYRGMVEGWFRADEKGPHTLARYFNSTENDPYNSREIVNGDKHIVPSWSHGVSIGDLIAGYHAGFLAALDAARSIRPAPGPAVVNIELTIDLPPDVMASVTVHGGEISNVTEKEGKS